jgi:hypothetical protein
LLGACHLSSIRPSELNGSWRVAQMTRGNGLAPLGRPYVTAIEVHGNALLLTPGSCGNENFAYRVDGARLTNECGALGVLCTNNLMGCGFALHPENERCTDTLPYCAARIRQDDEALVAILRTASSWHYSEGSFIVHSASADAEVRFVRNER